MTRFYQHVRTGQVVEVTEPPFYLDGLARWTRIEEGPSAPVAPEVTAPATAPESVEDETPVSESTDSAPPTPADMPQSVPDVPAPIEIPAAPELDPLPAGFDRDEWLDYAHAHGKTPAETKGVKTRVIAGWFTDN